MAHPGFWSHFTRKRFRAVLSVLIVIGLLVGSIYIGRNITRRTEAADLAREIDRHDIRACELMLNQGFNPNAVAELSDYRSGRDRSFTGIWHSIRDQFVEKSTGSHAKARPLLLIAIDETVRDQPDPVVVRMLLEHGANARTRDPQTGECALCYALRERQQDLVPLLLRYGADPNQYDTDGSPAIISVATRYIALTCERSANVNLADHYGNTALFLSCQLGNADRAKELIAHGADVNLGPAGMTPLSVTEDTTIRKMLMAHGARH